jgi:hypothetical protein
MLARGLVRGRSVVRARVGVFSDIGGNSELLDHPVDAMLLNDALDLRLHMPRCDQEVLGDCAHLFVLFTKQGDALRAGLDGALAQERDRFGDISGGGGDGLVDLPENGLVLADPGLLVRTHVCTHHR